MSLTALYLLLLLIIRSFFKTRLLYLDVTVAMFFKMLDSSLNPAVVNFLSYYVGIDEYNAQDIAPLFYWIILFPTTVFLVRTLFKIIFKDEKTTIKQSPNTEA